MYSGSASRFPSVAAQAGSVTDHTDLAAESTDAAPASVVPGESAQNTARIQEKNSLGGQAVAGSLRTAWAENQKLQVAIDKMSAHLKTFGQTAFLYRPHFASNRFDETALRTLADDILAVLPACEQLPEGNRSEQVRKEQKIKALSVRMWEHDSVFRKVAAYHLLRNNQPAKTRAHQAETLMLYRNSEDVMVTACRKAFDAVCALGLDTSCRQALQQLLSNLFLDLNIRASFYHETYPVDEDVMAEFEAHETALSSLILQAEAGQETIVEAALRLKKIVVRDNLCPRIEEIVDGVANLDNFIAIAESYPQIMSVQMYALLREHIVKAIHLSTEVLTMCEKMDMYVPITPETLPESVKEYSPGQIQKMAELAIQPDFETASMESSSEEDWLADVSNELSMLERVRIINTRSLYGIICRGGEHIRPEDRTYEKMAMMADHLNHVANAYETFVGETLDRIREDVPEPNRRALDAQLDGITAEIMTRSFFSRKIAEWASIHVRNLSTANEVRQEIQAERKEKMRAVLAKSRFTKTHQPQPDEKIAPHGNAVVSVAVQAVNEQKPGKKARKKIRQKMTGSDTAASTSDSTPAPTADAVIQPLKAAIVEAPGSSPDDVVSADADEQAQQRRRMDEKRIEDEIDRPETGQIIAELLPALQDAEILLRKSTAARRTAGKMTTYDSRVLAFKLGIQQADDAAEKFCEALAILQKYAREHVGRTSERGLVEQIQRCQDKAGLYQAWLDSPQGQRPGQKMLEDLENVATFLIPDDNELFPNVAVSGAAHPDRVAEVRIDFPDVVYVSPQTGIHAMKCDPLYLHAHLRPSFLTAHITSVKAMNLAYSSLKNHRNRRHGRRLEKRLARTNRFIRVERNGIAGGVSARILRKAYGNGKRL